MTDLEPEDVSLENSPWSFVAICLILLVALGALWFCAKKGLEERKSALIIEEEK